MVLWSNFKGSQLRRVNLASKWFGHFDKKKTQKSLPKRAGAREKRIKIAILDTGIDLSNVWIGQKKGLIECWPSAADCEDTDGHGTHVAYLLLRLAPHALLHVCKVSKTRLLDDAEIKKIAEVSKAHNF